LRPAEESGFWVSGSHLGIEVTSLRGAAKRHWSVSPSRVHLPRACAVRYAATVVLGIRNGKKGESLAFLVTWISAPIRWSHSQRLASPRLEAHIGCVAR